MDKYGCLFRSGLYGNLVGFEMIASGPTNILMNKSELESNKIGFSNDVFVLSTLNKAFFGHMINILEVELRSCGIKALHPQSFTGLKHLQVLVLSSNKIK